VPQDILDVSFPVAVRGYDRRAVDAYIKRINRVIAELKVRGSPPAAVRHALEQAEEKVQGLLRAAREAAEEMTASAQQEAEDNTARAKAEAAELTVNTTEADSVKAEADELIPNARREADDTVAKAKSEADGMLADAKAEVQNTLARAQTEADERVRRLQEELAALREEAETRRREIQADTEAVWKERHELLEDIRRMSGGLVHLANAAAAKFPSGSPPGRRKRCWSPRRKLTASRRRSRRMRLLGLCQRSGPRNTGMTSLARR
jgi:DivIVA domain-containing protein